MKNKEIMKTPAVPPANSNNSTLKRFDNNEEQLDYPSESLIKVDNELYENKNDENPYFNILNSCKKQEEEGDDQYPHLEEDQLNTQINSIQPIDHFLNSQPQLQPQPQLVSEPEPNENQMQSDNTHLIEIQCKQNEDSPISNEQSIQIKLSFPEKKVEKTGPLTKKKYLSFQITTMPFKYQVRRSYSDFLWLRQSLLNIYRGIFIPPIPLKKIKQSSSIEKIEKRMKHLENFVNSITNDLLLRSSKVFYDFISISNKEDFVKVKTIYDNSRRNKATNQKSPIDLSSLYSRSNNATIVLDPINAESIVQFDDMKSISKNTQAELSKLNKAFHMLFIEMKQVSDRLIELSSIFNSLSLISSYQNTRKNALSKSYDCLKQIMLDLSYNTRRHIVNYDIELKQYFKYLNGSYASLRSIYDSYAMAKEAFAKVNDKLKVKKEEYFNKGDVAKWDLNKEDVDGFDCKNKTIAISKMLPKETQSVKMLQMVYYYYANNCISEFNRVINVFGNETKKALDDFVSESQAITL